jgi:UDP-glucuronate 4-epimerase
MNVLITDGAGYIGSHLVDRLLDQGNNVITIDNFDPFYDRTIKESNIAEHRKHGNYRLIEEDIRDFEVLRKEITEDVDIDVNVHLAAKAGVPRTKIQWDFRT